MDCRKVKLEIPAVSSFRHPRKSSNLKRLTGKGWIYPGCWKRRFCVLDGTKLYFYDNESSEGNEKTAGVINLDYYDLCEEGTAKDHKRAPNVFTVGTSVRGFFDNRHLFSTETSEECVEWIKEINKAIDEARSHRSRSGRTKINGKDYLPEKQITVKNVENDLDVPISDRLHNITKDRARGPTGRRLPQRKSMVPSLQKKELENNSESHQKSTSLSALEDITEDEESDHRTSRSVEIINIEQTNPDDNFNTEDIFISQEDTNTSKVDSNSSPKLRCKYRGIKESAFLHELEMKVGVTKRHSENPSIPLHSEMQDDNNLLNVKNSVEIVRSRMTVLGTQVEHAERNISEIQIDVKKMQEQVDDVKTANDRLYDRTSTMEKQVDSVLQTNQPSSKCVLL